MTAPRRILEGQFYMVTRRTLLRTFFLRPHRDVNRMFEYCLAEAAARYDIELIAWCAMSNHYHAVIYDPDGRVPEFIERFHKMLAKALNVHYNRVESIWSRVQTCLTRLVTLEDVFDAVVYVLANPAAAHLVESISHWPGSSSWTRMGREAQTMQRPTDYFRADGRMPKTVALKAVAPRGLRGETYEEWIARVREAVKAKEDTLARERRKKNKTVLGCKAVLATRPTATPSTKEPRSKLHPHLACKDRKRMIEERKVLKDFRATYGAMLLRLRDGTGRVEFPEGTYRLRLLGLRCAGCTKATAKAKASRAKTIAKVTRAKSAKLAS
jgi:REP element-mobilizing transposase RayT